MLILHRIEGESIVIGPGELKVPVVVKVVRLKGDMVKLGIDAPLTIPVDRAEVRAANLAAAGKFVGERPVKP